MAGRTNWPTPVVVKIGTASGGMLKFYPLAYFPRHRELREYSAEGGGGAGIWEAGARDAVVPEEDELPGWLEGAGPGGGGVLTVTGFLPQAVRKTTRKRTPEAALQAG